MRAAARLQHMEIQIIFHFCHAGWHYILNSNAWKFQCYFSLDWQSTYTQKQKEAGSRQVEGFKRISLLKSFFYLGWNFDVAIFEATH